MLLSIQERLKDLRVERGLTLEQLAEQTHISKSALGGGNYEQYNRGFCYWRGRYAYRNSREINIIFG